MENKTGIKQVKRISVSVHVTEEMRDMLMQVSAKEDRSIAYLIRQAIKHWIKQNHGKDLK